MVAICREPIDVQEWARKVEDPHAGAFVTFEGRVRDHSEGGAVASLAYEAYEALAVREGERILQEARERFQVEKAALVHRVGELAIGECAVWVGVSAAHRREAFAACQYVIDELKERLPIWKRERYAGGGSVWVGDPSMTTEAAGE